MKIIEGNFTNNKFKFAIVSTRWNEFIVTKLVDGAIDALVRHGISKDNIDSVLCPGAFEVPLTVKKIAESKKYDGIIALGAVIRGSTPHFDYVASEVTKGIAQVSLSNTIPISFGVLTTDTIEQAIERAGTKAGNKGYESAVTCLEMCDLLQKL
jgi:6,7-dimethyl-8-ribityllumazine synthase